MCERGREEEIENEREIDLHAHTSYSHTCTHLHALTRTYTRTRRQESTILVRAAVASQLLGACGAGNVTLLHRFACQIEIAIFFSPASHFLDIVTENGMRYTFIIHLYEHS